MGDFLLHKRRQQRLIVPPHTAANENSFRIEYGRQVVQRTTKPASSFSNNLQRRGITTLRITEDDLKWLAEVLAEITPTDHTLEIAAIAAAAQGL